MLFPLKIEGFEGVLSAVGERESVSDETILWIIGILAALLILPMVAYRVRKWMVRKEALARGFDQLIKLSDHKGLDPVQQSTLERLALASPGVNPSAIGASIDGFDQAVRRRMPAVMKLPWLDMEQEVERIASVREKLGYRYIPEDRRPQNTRHLMLGQRIYILARGPEHFRLLSAGILELDDLAIYTEPFQDGDRVVKLKAKSTLWAFFWSPAGGECRFSTRVMRAYDAPFSYLMLEHGDELVYNNDRKIFSADVDVATTVSRISVEAVGRAKLSDELFETREVDTVPTQLLELSASGCVLSPSEAFKMGDLVKLEAVDDPELHFLNGWAARVVNEDGPTSRCRFLKKSRENLETILTYVTPRISKDALKGRSRRRTVTQT